jgi:2-polyprenyl-3-methyl-5-hydroxy-6-metoxy-1,4-benzoquinol methylase/uncharacterized protein YbaR (Trm112 family)
MTSLSPLINLLRCIECGDALVFEEATADAGYLGLGPDGLLRCHGCGELYPVIGGTARMLDRAGRAQLSRDYPAAGVSQFDDREASTPRNADAAVKQQTAESFAYEWGHFGAPRREWRKNFLDYMRPHGTEFFRDLLLLDVGAGSGRHSAQAAALGARVVAVDLGRSIDVTRSNVPPTALTVQADAERLPFAHGTFDFVMSIGVLHHLPEPHRALQSLVQYARPGGRVRVYLYWQPERDWHRRVLKLVTAVRRLTVRMPHRLLHQLCYPLAAALWVGVVLPYRGLRSRSRLRRLADTLPLQTYADYPFEVLVNDQFDRFSAPLERRYTRIQVEAMLRDAGLENVSVMPNYGWIGEGRVPEAGVHDRSRTSAD